MDTESLLPYLRQVAKEAAGDAKPHEIATHGGADPSTVRRFLNAIGGWPSKTDEIVVGCAVIADRRPYELWQDAVNRWITAQRAAADGSPGTPDRPRFVEPTAPTPLRSPGTRRRRGSEGRGDQQ